MADINIANLPDAGAVANPDFLHISQSGSDFKITIANLSAKFGEVEIFGLLEDPAPLGGYTLPMANLSGDITQNQKVELATLAVLFQEEQFYSNDDAIDSDDKLFYRKDSANAISQVGVTEFRALLLDYPNDVAITVLAENDVLSTFDISAGSPVKKITTSNMRLNMLDTTNLNALSDVTLDVADTFNVYDQSTTTASKLTYANLLARLATDFNVAGSFLSRLLADSAAGTITFNGVPSIKVERIDSITASGIVITDDVTIQNALSVIDVNATNVTARFYGETGVAGGAYLSSEDIGFISNFITVNSGISGGIAPSATGTNMWLGTSSRHWSAAFIDNIETDFIEVSSTAFLPTNTQINAAPLMDGATISPNILPIADFGTRGAIELATKILMEDNNSLAAITPNSIFLAKEGTTLAGTGIPNILKETGSFQMGNFIVNYGYLIFEAAYNTNIQDITIPFNTSSLRPFTNDTTFCVMLQDAPDIGVGEDQQDFFFLHEPTDGNSITITLNRQNGNWETKRLYFLCIGF